MFYNMRALLLFFITTCCVPVVAFALPNYMYITNIGILIQDLVTAAIPVLVVIALAVFIWGLITFIRFADNETEREKGRNRMLWGVIGLFIMLSVWGLVSLVQDLTGVRDSTPGGMTSPDVP